MEQSLKSLILNRCFATIQESNNIFLASSKACYGIIISKSYGIYRLFDTTPKFHAHETYVVLCFCNCNND